jgi:hypothetical protein
MSSKKPPKPPKPKKEKVLKKEKTKRPDIAERKKENEELDFTVIKTTLNSFINIVEGIDLKSMIKDTFDYLLFESNKAIVEAYNLANFHAIIMIKKGLTVDPNQTFYYQCLSAVSSQILE